MTELLNRLGDTAPWTGTWAEPLFGVPLRVLVVVLAGLLARHLLHRVIDRVCAGIAAGTAGLARLDQRLDHRLDHRLEQGRVTATQSLRREQRARTVSSVLDSLTTAVVASVVVIIVLELMSVPVAPLLASAGIVGVALGFGAQSLVKDVISGVFMLAEDQYGVGDVVDLGDASGTVEAVGLRVTQLRDVHGTVWYVRNGEVLRVGNQSQGWARAVLDIPVGYDEDLTKVQGLLMDAASSLRTDPAFRDMVTDDPQVWGVEDFSADSVVVRLAVETQPLRQWDVARELRRRIKDRFDAEGIEMAHAEGTLRIAEAPDPDAAPPDGPNGTDREPAE